MTRITVKLVWCRYCHSKEHQPFVIDRQSRFYPRIWPLSVITNRDRQMLALELGSTESLLHNIWGLMTFSYCSHYIIHVFII